MLRIGASFAFRWMAFFMIVLSLKLATKPSEADFVVTVVLAFAGAFFWTIANEFGRLAV